MSKIAVDLEQARHGAGARLPRLASRSEMMAVLPAADRATYSRWSRVVATLYAALALLGAVSFVAVHDYSDDELRALGIGPALLADPAHVRAGGRVEGIEDVDAEFFGRLNAILGGTFSSSPPAPTNSTNCTVASPPIQVPSL